MKLKLALIGIGAAVVLTGAWYLALWKPASGNLTEARDRETAASTKVTELTTELARLKQIEANKEVLERDKAALAAKVPDKDKLDEFILELNQIANTSGITLQSLSPGEPAPAVPGAVGTTPGAVGTTPVAVGPVPVTLQMQVQGDYFAILRFMDAVRDGTRLIVVDNLSLSKGGEGGQMSASIGGRMFIAAPAPAPAPTTPTVTESVS